MENNHSEAILRIKNRLSVSIKATVLLAFAVQLTACNDEVASEKNVTAQSASHIDGNTVDERLDEDNSQIDSTMRPLIIYR